MLLKYLPRFKMQNKILLLVCTLFLAAVYLRYNKTSPSTSEKNNVSRQRIQWTKNSPLNNTPQETEKKKPNKVNYFSFPSLDELKTTDDVTSFSQQYSIKKIGVEPNPQAYHDILAKDVSIAIEILKSIEAPGELTNNLQDNSYISDVKVLKPQKHYAINVKELYWLEIYQLRGSWRPRKVNRESTWLSNVNKRVFFTIGYANVATLNSFSAKQYDNQKNFYHFLNDIRKRNIEATTNKEFFAILQETANLIASTVMLYHQTDVFIIKQQLGFYYQNLVYEWNISRKNCAKLYCDASQESVNEKELNLAAVIYPVVENYRDIAFIYLHHNQEQAALSWIHKIKEQDFKEGEYCLAKFYVQRDKNKALQHLENALQKGFSRFDEIIDPDGDFESLHKDSNYQKILYKYLYNY